LLGEFPEPDGAFYLYADSRALGDDSRRIAHRLLHEAGVAVTPGSDFDPEAGHLALRLSFAGRSEDMHEACDRIRGWVKQTKR
jgi:aspartate/methionine/tyrosine aminotransferase